LFLATKPARKDDETLKEPRLIELGTNALDTLPTSSPVIVVRQKLPAGLINCL
jgi:hypothetical protein